MSDVAFVHLQKWCDPAADYRNDLIRTSLKVRTLAMR